MYKPIAKKNDGPKPARDDRVQNRKSPLMILNALMKMIYSNHSPLNIYLSVNSITSQIILPASKRVLYLTCAHYNV